MSSFPDQEEGPGWEMQEENLHRRFEEEHAMQTATTAPSPIRSSGESLAELFDALAKAQAEIEGALKDNENPHFRSRYADLGAVWNAIREPLTKNGLSVMQFPQTRIDDNGTWVVITTRLSHSSGQWLESDLSVPVLKVDAQGIGSATTYGRRYALQAVAGVAPEDDDGNGAVGDRQPPQQARPQPRATQNRAPNLQPPSGQQNGRARSGTRTQPKDHTATERTPAEKLELHVGRLQTAQNLATLRELYKVAIRDLHGCDDELARLEAAKDRLKEKFEAAETNGAEGAANENNNQEGAAHA